VAPHTRRLGYPARCRRTFDPGYGDDLVVTITDPVVFARWHLGLIKWTTALRSCGLEVTGPPRLRRALPTWNGAPAVFASR
jgi:hypothetical protein